MTSTRLLALYRSDQILEQIQRRSGKEALWVFLRQLGDERFSLHSIAEAWGLPVFSVRLMRETYTYDKRTLREELDVPAGSTLVLIHSVRRRA